MQHCHIRVASTLATVFALAACPRPERAGQAWAPGPVEQRSGDALAPTSDAAVRPGAGSADGSRVDGAASSEAIRVLAEGYNEFSCELYQKLRAAPGNVVFSPISIATTFTALHAGARGETQRQLQSMLRLPEKPLPVIYELWTRLQSAGKPGPKLDIATRLFVGPAFPVIPAYAQLLDTYFGAQVVSLDFSNGEHARREINSWVSGSTGGRISDMLPASLPLSSTGLVLVNAINFRASWERAFDPASTRPAPFKRSRGGVVTALMMNKALNLPYADVDGGTEIVELPYQAEGDRDLAYVVIIPKTGQLSSVEDQIKSGQLSGWLAKLRPRAIDLSLPKYRLVQYHPLDSYIKALGATAAFHEPDLSGITQTRAAAAWAVHAASIRNDEAGSEASAATAYGVLVDGGVVLDPLRISVDRSHLFLIRDRRSGAFLFMGRVEDPT